MIGAVRKIGIRGFVRHARTRPGVVSGVILLGGILTMVVAIIGIAVSWGNIIAQTYFTLAFTTPGFDYEVTGAGETGNATFDAYLQMRLVGLAMIAVVFIYAGIARVMESTELGLVQQGTSNKVISKSVIFIIILLVFPPIWDGLSDTLDGISLWVLNPNFSHDRERPCIDELYEDPDTWIDLYNSSPYSRDQGTVISLTEYEPYRPNTYGVHSISSQGPTVTTAQKTATAMETLEKMCYPEYKVEYIFAQMLKDTQANATQGLNLGKSSSWLGGVQDNVQSGASGPFTNLFIGLTKALVSIQLLIMSLLIGIMTDMLVAMVIAGLPIFLVLSLIPKADEVANKFIEAIPALLLIPIMSAIIIVVGAGSIAEAPGRSLGTTDATIYTWITSLGVVFFSITLPILMVPLLKGVTSQAQQVVSSAVQSSAMVSGMAASGMAGGIAGAKAVHGGKGAAAFGHMALGALKGMGGGLFRGSSASMGNVGGFGVGPDKMTNMMGREYGGARTGAGANLDTVDKQHAAIDTEQNNLKGQGANVGTNKDLVDRGIARRDGHYGEKTDSQGNPIDHDKQTAKIDKDIEDWRSRNPNPSPEDQRAIDRFQNEHARTLNKPADQITKEDINGLKQYMQDKTPNTQIADNVLERRITHNIAQDKGIDERSFRAGIN